MTPTDVVVVGAGPAGAATALTLARIGLLVTVLEARTGSKSKVCGEGIMPAGVAILDELGLLDEALRRGARRFSGIRYYASDGTLAGGKFPGSDRGVQGLAMPRSTLDALLMDAVGRQPGIEVIESCVVSDVIVEGGRVRGVHARSKGGTQRRFLGRLTIGADGLHSRFHALPTVTLTRPKRRRMGLSTHAVNIAPLMDEVEVHLVPGGELYLTPETSNMASLALLVEAVHLRPGFSPESMLRAAAQSAPALRDRLANAQWPQRVGVYGPLGLCVKGAAGPGYFLIGDAAGALDPITGEGLALGLATAADLGSAIRKLGLDDEATRTTDRLRWRRELGLKGLTGALLTLSAWPSAAHMAICVMARVPRLFGSMLGVAAGLRDPVPGLVRQNPR